MGLPARSRNMNQHCAQNVDFLFEVDFCRRGIDKLENHVRRDSHPMDAWRYHVLATDTRDN